MYIFIDIYIYNISVNVDIVPSNHVVHSSYVCAVNVQHVHVVLQPFKIDANIK